MAFDVLWAETVFETCGEPGVVYKALRDLATLGLLDHGTAWIIRRAICAWMTKLWMRDLVEKEKPKRELKRYAGMVRALQKSPYGFVLRPEANRLLSNALTTTTWADFARCARKEISALIEAKEPQPQSFIVALVALDLCGSPTKRTNYTETFFACTLADWFKAKQGNPNWKAVHRITLVCFSDDGPEKEEALQKKEEALQESCRRCGYGPKNEEALQESCRRFRAKFDSSRAMITAVLEEAANPPPLTIPLTIPSPG
ncbi:MAG TPA: hypothetical protein VNN77_06280 [candidate division Zixibacteria bacterium]|nr:hypothetical protein [candidate division Zixibacteria bacterium]